MAAVEFVQVGTVRWGPYICSRPHRTVPAVPFLAGALFRGQGGIPAKDGAC